ncbi:hypothetical protein TH25_24790 [Thalassospira profundimaris]|uniref:HTH araC/xylS-type domain-containing protein n=1 Tax=Thalassospira profundimaris TaxID=502049 RepID=A0A367WGZ5_9PROT|nr:AraC family transcriptional regulator [Thalassospira profundimaris]RCK40529.1 hypothetical protein TH25_24790 [Thalassospira profundimaris]
MTKGQIAVLPTSRPGTEAVAACSAHHFARHSHDVYGIGIIDQGGQKSASGRGIVEAGPGTVITVNPGEIHDGVPVAGEPRQWRILYFQPGILKDALNAIFEGGAPEHEFTSPIFHRPALTQYFNRIYGHLTSINMPDGDENFEYDELLILLARASLEQAHQPDENRLIAPGVFRAKQQIDDAPGETLQLDVLAQTSGLGKYQLIRNFSRATGYTPHAYLVQRRALLARQLILQKTPLAEAAIAAGFSDQSHMTRQFIRFYGYSPGKLARSIGSN